MYSFNLATLIDIAEDCVAKEVKKDFLEEHLFVISVKLQIEFLLHPISADGPFQSNKQRNLFFYFLKTDFIICFF